MATGSVRSTAAPQDTRVAADKLIEVQLKRVRRHIRITDLIAGILVLLAGVVAFLTVAAIVDHWIVGLGVVGRWMALVIIVCFAAWHLVMNVGPLLLKRINPTYAAQTIERGEPTLKNSLLNYLLLRRESEGVAGLIYQAVQQRAAADVSRIQVDQTVDRSVLIRAGYVLASIMAIAGAYKILSPKDPFQTVRRIALPWSDIARPARVTIESVEPGDAQVLQGQTIELSAIVRGTRTSDAVTLMFSTVDGQIIDRTIAMKLDSAGLRHVTSFPANGSGIQQDVVYRITAGDAATKTYRLQVSPAPTMTVESVEYDFPAYTQRTREILERQGDMKAVEGTRVTVRARSNQPIKSATVDLGSLASSSLTQTVQERLPMEFRDSTAWRAWRLELAADHRSPKYSAYQTTFLNQAGISSRDPVVYRIDVFPDLPPELEVLTPAKETVQIPVSGQQRIEIRAIDPDFGLTGVRLKGICAGQEIIDQSLFENSIGQTGQVIAEWDFRPSAFKLSAGSQVTYWVVAADNRVTEASPKPNTTRSANRTFVIVEDPPRQENKTGEPSPQEAEKEKDPPPNSNPSKSTEKKKEPNSGKEPDSQQNKDAQKSQKSDSQKQGQSQSGGKSDSEQKSGDRSQATQGSQSGGQPQAGEESNEKQQQGGDATSNQPSTAQPGQGAKGQESGGSTPQKQDQPGANPTSPGSQPNAAGENRPGNSPGQRTDPVHDGEVFEKALERLKKQPEGTEQQENPGTSTEDDPNPQKSDAPPSSGDSKANGKSQDATQAQPDQSTEKGNAGAEAEKGEPGTKAKPSETASQGKKGSQEGQDSGQKKTSDQGAEANDKSKGAGDKKTATKDASGQSPGEQPKSDAEKRSGSNEQNPGGGGQKNADKTGSGERPPQGDKRTTQPPDKAAPQSGDPPPPNQEDKPSDSQGQESGDRSGGGKKGTGQGSQQQGKDNAGSNTPSDAGAGAAPEAGSGEKSSSPGQQQPAATPTGSSGNEKGSGSKTKSDPNGKQSSSQTPPATESPQQDPSGQPPSKSSNSGGKSPGGNRSPTGGGQASEQPPGTPPNTEVEPGDDPNLEYTRRATDMVLEYLKDQQKKPDDKLLDELGWTPEDLQRFLDRWQKLKESAKEDSAARRELDETLRGLGLRPQADTKRAAGSKSDELRGLRESGLKSKPPSSYQEQFNAFKKGTARSQSK